MAKKPKTCCVPGCQKPVRARGMCEACYRTAARKVDRGEISWAMLVKKGLARPYRETQRSPLTAALEKVKA